MPESQVFQDRSCSIYLSASVAREFPWREFPECDAAVIPIRDEPLPDDPLPRVQEANHRLMEAFARDWQAAKDAIEAEARNLAMGAKGEVIKMTVKGVPLLVKCWVSPTFVNTYVMSLQ